MNKNKSVSGATEENNNQSGINVRSGEKSLYTWEITRVHKKVMARSGHRFLVLKINIPVKSEKGDIVHTYQAHYELKESQIKDDSIFKDYCVRGFQSMREKLIEKGVEIPEA